GKVGIVDDAMMDPQTECYVGEVPEFRARCDVEGAQRGAWVQASEDHLLRHVASVRHASGIDDRARGGGAPKNGARSIVEREKRKRARGLVVTGTEVHDSGSVIQRP